jgi:phosphonate transport system permease protein
MAAMKTRSRRRPSGLAASTEMNRTERQSLVSAPVAALLSALVPGLGQIFAGMIQRGVLLLGSMATLVALMAWRIDDLGHRESTIIAKVYKAFDLNPTFMAIMAVGIAVLWVWTVWDAVRQTRPEHRGGFILFAFVLLRFFGLGWQISQIDVYKAVTKFPEALPTLGKVMWPWEAAVTRKTAEVKAGAPILVDASDNPPAVPPKVAGKPYLKVTPTYGNLSKLDQKNDLIPGSSITIEGEGFAPNVDTQIWWLDSLSNEFRPRDKGAYVNVTTDAKGSFSLSMVMPYRLIPPAFSGQQIHRVEARQISAVGGLIPSEPLLLTIGLMVETIFMGMMATFFGILLSIPISFLAARNLMSGSPITYAIYFITRTVLNIVRAIEPLIWALIAVVWVGLGPFAGILALTIHSVAALGKLYSEAIEGIDAGPIEAIEATGATRLQTIVYAVIPQMIPPFVSFSIYRWDTNVRMSTIIGLVGGGGIGFLLVQYVRLLDYRAAGIAVWFIAVTVAILDYVSAEIKIGRASCRERVSERV